MKSFNEILEEKLKTPLENNYSDRESATPPYSKNTVEDFQNKSNTFYFSSEDAYDLDLNRALNDFFQRGNSSFISKKAGFNSYKVKIKTVKSKPHNLSPIQKRALAWFNCRGLPLDEFYSKTELAKCFRRLAFVLHPDYNNDPAADSLYRTLHESKELLMEVFDVKSK